MALAGSGNTHLNQVNLVELLVARGSNDIENGDNVLMAAQRGQRLRSVSSRWGRVHDLET